MKKEQEQTDFTKLAIATIAGVLILGGAIYGAYRYSQKQAGNVTLPGGVTYLGPSPNPTAGTQQPPTAPLRFTADASTPWKDFTGKYYPFSFSYPSTLPLVVFIGDTNDTVAISWGNIPPQQNILLNLEFLDKKDPKYLSQPKVEYVKDWYKFFSGLKGVEKIEPFTTASGLRGYKASYINYSNSTPNTDVFFDIPGRSNLMIHMANGIIDPTIFNRMLDSVKWTPPSPKK